MKVEWTETAEDERDAIVLHIAADNIDAALRMEDLFKEAADRLAEFPKLGPPGKLPGTREILPHESYRLVYEITGDTVFILRLLHTKRRW